MFFYRVTSLNISDSLKELQKILFIFLPFAIFTGPFLSDLFITIIGLIFILMVGLQLIIGGLVDLEILKINEEFKKYF